MLICNANFALLTLQAHKADPPGTLPDPCHAGFIGMGHRGFHQDGTLAKLVDSSA